MRCWTPIAPRFARYEPLRHAAALLQGMVSGLDRKNCWTIAEHRGQGTPDGLQHLLARARWDADAVRDDPETRPGEQAGGEHHALIRRNDTTGELAYHRCWSPTPVPLPTLVTVAGQRWRIEESYQAAKGLVGLDQHQVRRWTSLAAPDRAGHARPRLPRRDTAAERAHHPAPSDLIEVTVAEFRRLFDALLLHPRHTLSRLLAWSRWRRRHQARARQAHYRRREQR